jgi:hypothetical protein
VIRSTFALFLAALTLGCNPKGPPRGPEETCVASCQHVAKSCQEEECWRGCNLVLDRLAENEGDRIVECVASMGAHQVHELLFAVPPGLACDDRTWARCAVRVGVHSDGGPPAPPPPKDWDEDDSN